MDKCDEGNKYVLVGNIHCMNTFKKEKEDKMNSCMTNLMMASAVNCPCSFSKQIFIVNKTGSRFVIKQSVSLTLRAVSFKLPRLYDFLTQNSSTGAIIMHYPSF